MSTDDSMITFSDPRRRVFVRLLLGGAIGAGWLRSQTADGKKTAAASPHLVRFGNTDLQVSRICQGTAFRVNRRDPSDERAQAVLRRCFDVGINFFDSSNAYGWGGSELALGKAIRGKRSNLVVCTKVHPALKPKGSEPPVKVAFSREFASRELEGSLKRIGTDYIDLYLLHNPDGITPPEEVAQTMDSLVRSGKIRYWGVSNHEPNGIAKFSELGVGGGSRIGAVQNHYNIINRQLEREMFPLLRRTKIALMPYGPLDEGRLLRPLPKGQEGKSNLLTAVDRVGRQVGATRAQVLIAWVLSHPEATCALLGAETPQHVDENYGAVSIKLPPELVTKLNAASDAWLAAESKTTRSHMVR